MPQPNVPAPTEPDPDAETVAKLAKAEEFVDAFYSGDSDALLDTVAPGTDMGFASFAQAWAQGADFEVLVRSCEVAGVGIRCEVTSRDAISQALELDFNITDTFLLLFSDGEISSIGSTSDDPPLVHALFTWVQINRPDVWNGLCGGFFDGGPTPIDCAEAILDAAQEFKLTDEYAEASG